MYIVYCSYKRLNPLIYLQLKETTKTHEVSNYTINVHKDNLHILKNHFLHNCIITEKNAIHWFFVDIFNFEPPITNISKAIY